jgi:hypothetical protein
VVRTPPPPPRLADLLREAGPLLGLGMQFALMIVICLAIGLWVDNRYLIAPWGTLVGGIVGIVGGFYHFLKTVTRHTRNNK